MGSRVRRQKSSSVPPLTGGRKAISSPSCSKRERSAISWLTAVTRELEISAKRGKRISHFPQRPPRHSPSGISTSSCVPPARSRAMPKNNTFTVIESVYTLRGWSMKGEIRPSGAEIKNKDSPQSSLRPHRVHRENTPCSWFASLRGLCVESRCSDGEFQNVCRAVYTVDRKDDPSPTRRKGLEGSRLASRSTDRRRRGR